MEEEATEEESSWWGINETSWRLANTFVTAFTAAQRVTDEFWKSDRDSRLTQMTSHETSCVGAVQQFAV